MRPQDILLATLPRGQKSSYDTLQWKDMEFYELAFEIAKLYVGEEIPLADLKALMQRRFLFP
jgi:threonine synthase